MIIPFAVSQTLANEFALPDAETLTLVGARLLTAIALGGALGLERESKGRAAGLKTHILVSVGSALFVLAPLQMGVAPGDVTQSCRASSPGSASWAPGPSSSWTTKNASRG
jgi:putative Mg2+ transporter-C (MgtC) family protein